MEITRRRFLGLTGAAAGITLLPSELAELVGLASHPEERWPGPGVETWTNTVCQLCTGGCGLRVRMLDGWPVRVKGNPTHPINRGGICLKGAASLQSLYDPDRIRRPLKRVGERGEGKWEEISWEQALGEITPVLTRLREARRPESLVVMGGQFRGQMGAIWQRFLAAYGSPNYLSPSASCATSDTILWLTQGVRSHVGYDLERTNYLLDFGVGLLEASWSPVWQMRAFADLRQGRPGQHVKIVHVDPRFSITAAKADEWLPIRPGTDGALALGIAHVLVSEKLCDQAFLDERTLGFDDWVDDAGKRHEGFSTMVLRDYPPSRAAKITGIEESRISRIAREFAEYRPAIAMGDRGVLRYSNGFYTRWAIHCLNALVGSVDAPGGVLVPPEIPFTPLPPLPPDPVAEAGRGRQRLDGAGSPGAPLASSVIERLPEAIRTGVPYPVEALFMYYTNPLFSLSESLGMRDALERVPFIVDFTPYMDESAQMADLILPDHNFLERWQDDPTPPNVPFPVLGIRQPVRPALYDSQATSDVIFRLAKSLGGPVAAAFPWESTEAFLKERVQGVYEAGRGKIGAPPEWPWMPEEEEETPPASYDEFWTKLLERGAWYEPEYVYGDWKRVLATPSGRFEFYSQNLRALLTTASKRVGAFDPAFMTQRPRGDGAYLPRFEPPEPLGDPEDYPLVLNVFRPLSLMGGRTANIPYLLERAGHRLQSHWETWIEIHPDTAHRYGITDESFVWVESPLGKVKARARARLQPGALEGVVSMPFGLGHKEGGRWGKGIGANPNPILGATLMSVTGESVSRLTRVRIKPA